jgi:tRNA(adenine34) deaminase
MYNEHEKYMLEAIKEAEKALTMNEVPIGAIIVKDGVIIARGHNTREIQESVLGHAEINAIQEASRKIGTWRLTECDMYVTIEPCPMCSGAIFQSRLRAVYFGSKDEKAGLLGSKFNLFSIEGLNHYVQVNSGLLEEQCKALMTNFFKKKRNK